MITSKGESSGFSRSDGDTTSSSSTGWSDSSGSTSSNMGGGGKSTSMSKSTSKTIHHEDGKEVTTHSSTEGFTHTWTEEKPISDETPDE